jgi:hypothetical protein
MTTLTHTASKSQLLIATDSEWASDETWLSTQFAILYKGQVHQYFCLTSNCPADSLETIETRCATEGIKLIVAEMTDQLNLLESILPDFGTGKLKADLLMFASPKDLEFAIGWENFDRIIKLKENNLKQKRCIQGSFNIGKTTIRVRDMYGWQPQGGLKGLADSVGIKMVAKSALDAYKSNMETALALEPTTFLDYAMGDVTDLLNIYPKFIELVQWVQRDVIGIPEDKVATIDNLSMTTGSIVAKTLESWFYTQTSYNPEVLDFAVRKLGIIDLSKNTNLKWARSTFHSCNQDIRSAGDVQLDKLKGYFGIRFEALGYSQTSVLHLAKSRHDSAVFASLVQGGRCNNEMPQEFRITTGADIDLSSCYGSALRDFIYPMGLPTIVSYKPNERRKTLKEILRLHESQLVAGLWTMVVNGDLSFCQDLVYSKIATADEINRAAYSGFDKETTDETRDDDISHIPGEFALLRQQLCNGVITSDILEVIRKVANKAELAEFLNLDVECLVYYPKSERVDFLDSWIDLVLANDQPHTTKKDSRTRKWVGLSLNDFIGKLVDIRKSLKKGVIPEGLKVPGGTDKESLKSLQNGLKLFINTTYGVSASVYFQVSNTVLANNITARARRGAWQLAKALRTRQSITDGGMYGLMEVSVLDMTKPNSRKPGFHILSDMYSWVNNRLGRYIAPLAGINWELEDFGADIGDRLDSLARTHLETFWANYQLGFQFGIEHKGEHTFQTAAYWNKGHYAIRPFQGETIYKVRGSKLFKDDKRSSPTFEMLDHILDGSDEFPTELVYDHFYLLKINKYLEVQKSNGFESLKSKRPGAAIVESRIARYNNLHFPLMTADDFKARSGRKTISKGLPVELFERYRTAGISKVHAKMRSNELRDSYKTL